MYQAALAAPKEEEKQSFADKVVDKIAGPEPIKPTSALAKKLVNEKKSKLKQRLISASSESESDDEDTFNRTSATPKVDIEQSKYLPPQLAINTSLNDSVVSQRRLDQLAMTPRSSMTAGERQA